MLDLTPRRIEAIDAVIHGTEPYAIAVIYHHRHDGVVVQPHGRIRSAAISHRLAGTRIDRGNTGAQRTYPERAALIDGERGDGVGRLIGEAVVAERPGTRVPARNAAGFGTDPQQAAAILEKRGDFVVGQALL